MKLIKKVKNKDNNFIYNNYPKNLIKVVNVDRIPRNFNLIFDFISKYLPKSTPTGRYMIKKEEIKYNRSYHYIVRNKSYFCFNNKGRVFVGHKRDEGIFKLNSYRNCEAVIKHLIVYDGIDSEFLYSIVDRRTGNTIYHIPTTHVRFFTDNLIILK